MRRVAQLDPAYGDVVREQLAWLAAQDELRARAAREAAAGGAPPPMPTWLDRPPTYIPPPNFPTYRPPAPR
ncbi:hypothetical protein ACFRAQ_25050 [Nocardia sp. NPDC056611]|uniref:hypothetical protein n=1 Tax=Nocardia sp. NPDC056611 TaxID=3345877 RepID=UPI00366F7872